MRGHNLFAIADQLGHRKKNGQVSTEMINRHYGTWIREYAPEELTGYGTSEHVAEMLISEE